MSINGDLALLKGLCKAVLAFEDQHGGILDWAFIHTYTSGFEAFKEDVESTAWSDIETGSGLSQANIEEAARVYCESNATIAYNRFDTARECCGNDSIRGQLSFSSWNIGKPGAGPCPVRGHSNVQGDRTMGIWEAPKDSFLDKLGDEFGFEPPRHHGLAAVDAIQAMHATPGKVFFALGGNFLSANPDTDFTARALQNCRLTVQVSTKLNRSHLITGDTALILPCLGRTDIDIQNGVEQFVTTENSQGYVSPSRGFLAPPSTHCKSEPEIIARVAAATLRETPTVDWMALAADYRRIRSHISQCDSWA